MKHLFKLLFLLLVPHFLLAQKQGQPLIDSLLKELPMAKEDTNKVSLLNDLAYAYAPLEHDIGIKYCGLAMALSEHLQWQKGKAMSYHRYGCCNKNDYPVALEYYQKSLKLFEELNDYSWQITTLSSISILYRWQKKYQETHEYRLQALRLCEKKGIKKDISNILTGMGNDCLFQHDYPQALEYFLQSLVIEEEIKDKTREDLLGNIALIYYIQKDPSKTFEYYNKELKLGEELGDKKIKSEAFLHFGNFFVAQNEYLKAMDCFRQSLKLKEEVDDRYGSAVVLSQIMGIYANQADYINALTYGLRSLKLAEDLNNKALIASSQNDVSGIYVAMKNYPKALDYLLGALKLLEETGNKEIIPVTTGNIGYIYYNMGNYPKAIEYLQKSLKLAADEAKSSLYFPSDVLAMSLDELGDVYRSMHNYSMALNMAFKSLKLNLDRNDIPHMSKNLENIGKNYLEIAKRTGADIIPDSLAHLSKPILLKRSISYINRSIGLCKEISSIDNLQENYQLLSEAQSMQGDDKNALKSYKQYIFYRDSVFSIEKTKAFTSRDMQYDFDKKEAATKVENDKKAAAIKAENDKQKEAGKAKLRQYGIVATALLIILLLSFYFYRKREKDKFKVQILEVKQEALNAQMSDHFIGNTMDSINGFIKNNDKEKASEYLVLFSRLIRKVLENATEKMIPLKDDLGILKNYLELEKLRFPAGHLQYEISTANDIDMANTLIPPMVFQVLAENAIKHGFRKTAGGKLLLTVEKKNNSLECVVEDNGIGRRAAQAGGEGANKERVSYGGSLAEKLVKTGGKQTSYAITDLQDDNDNAAGTRVVFTLPYILAE